MNELEIGKIYRMTSVDAPIKYKETVYFKPVRKVSASEYMGRRWVIYGNSSETNLLPILCSMKNTRKWAMCKDSDVPRGIISQIIARRF